MNDSSAAEEAHQDRIISSGIVRLHTGYKRVCQANHVDELVVHAVDEQEGNVLPQFCCAKGTSHQGPWIGREWLRLQVLREEIRRI